MKVHCVCLLQLPVLGFKSKPTLINTVLKKDNANESRVQEAKHGKYYF